MTQEETPSGARSVLYGIPDGVAGIRATLDLMAQWTRQYRTDPIIRSMAETIVAAIPGKDYYGEVEAVRDWVRNNIRYTRDVYDVETVKTPLALIQSRFGDCDDMALLTGTLLNSIGHPVRYVAIGTTVPGEFDHVYPETKINLDRWVSVETTEPFPIGWRPESMTAYMVARV